jgi:hypothetical protein
VEYDGLVELIGAVVFLAAVFFFLPAQWRGKWNDRSGLILWAVCLVLVVVAFLTIKFGS